MRVIKISIFLSLVLLMAGAGVAAGEESSLGVSVTADAYSKYIWRGQNLVDDWVLQPGVNLSYGGFSGGAWSSSDMTGDAGDNDDFEFTEWDYFGGYSGTVPGIEWLGFSVGAIYYYFPGEVEGTTEIYWSLSVDTLLSPSVTVYHDIDEVDGTYVSFGLAHSIEKIAELSPNMPVGMNLGFAVGWGDSDYNEVYWDPSVDSSELNDLSAKLSFPVAMGSWTLTPSVSYISLLSDDIRDNNGYSNDNDFVVTGLSLSTSF